jgi:hypothetical protein
VLKQGDGLIAAKFKSLKDATELESVVDACVGLRTELDGMLRLMDCSRKTWELVLCYIKRKEFVPLMTVMIALAARLFRCAAVLALALHGAWAAVASKTKLLPAATQEVLVTWIFCKLEGGWKEAGRRESVLFYQLLPAYIFTYSNPFTGLGRRQGPSFSPCDNGDIQAGFKPDGAHGRCRCWCRCRCTRRGKD